MQDIKERRKKHTDRQIVAALASTHGMIYLAAKRLDCDPSTIHRRSQKSAAIRTAIEASRGELIDVAEVALMAAVQAKQPWAVAFALKTVGRHRGFVERVEQEHSGAGGGPIVVKAFEYGTAVAEIAPGPGGDSLASGEGESDSVRPTLGKNGHGG